MAFPITVEDIKTFCPESATVSDAMIQMYIDYIDEMANNCLDGRNAPDSVQIFMKTNAVCHLISRGQGGQVKSESDMDGASVTFETYRSAGYGLASTVFGQNILNGGFRACFGELDQRPNRFVAAVGR